MKVLCVRPGVGLLGGHTYTVLSETTCPGCGKRWYEIDEASHPMIPAQTTVVCCDICDRDLPDVTPLKESHMYRTTRFIPIDPGCGPNWADKTLEALEQ